MVSYTATLGIESGPILLGTTAVGRATVIVLNVNDPFHVEQRALLVAAGLFPLD